MSNLLARGAAVLKAKHEAYASESLCVMRGVRTLIDDWAATPGKNPVELQDELGATVSSTQFDWIGDTSRWGIDGAQSEPQRGDVIYWDRGDYVLIFEVLPGDGENVSSPSGPFGERSRVHTKLIERRVK